MARNDSNRNESPRPMRSPIASAVILLAFYIAMYLAIAAVVQALDPASTDTAAPDSPPAPVAAATAPDCRPTAPYDLRCQSD